jgi:SNF2 family DNA or RNA helicase
MTRFTPHPYQLRGMQFLLANKRAGLFFDPGLGKTATTLSAINGLLRAGLVEKVLIVAPLRVIYSVWPAQVAHWQQFGAMRVSIVHGTRSERTAALRAPADVYAINPEGLQWLVEQERPNWQMLVVDESTKFKSPKSKCFKALKEMLPEFDRRVILTGTPSPNGLEDLWAQIYLLDEGERLGKRITHFRERFFHRGGFRGYEWAPNPRSQQEIEQRISDIVLRLDAADYLQMPELITNDIEIDLPGDIRKAYRKLEKELFFELDGAEVQTTSAGAKYLMCRQVANGGLYVDGNAEHVHQAKIEALESIHDELGGKPLLVAYQFQHDLERLKAWHDAPHIGGGVSPAITDRLVKQWNTGGLPLLYVQPQAMSHGLNMQGAGNDIVWFGLTDNLETYSQTNARIYRQGVRNNVRVHRLLAKGTVDMAMRRRIDNKEEAQKSLLDSLRDYMEARNGSQEEA